MLACTDAGRAKWVESLANELDVPPNFVFKRRHDNGYPEIRAMIADVEGRSVVIYDDMIRSGDSLLNAARVYWDSGAESVAAVTTHGLSPGEEIFRIAKSGIIDRLVCTNCHPGSLRAAASSWRSVPLFPCWPTR